MTTRDLFFRILPAVTGSMYVGRVHTVFELEELALVPCHHICKTTKNKNKPVLYVLRAVIYAFTLMGLHLNGADTLENYT